MDATSKVLGGMFLAACFWIGFLLPSPFRHEPAPPQAQPSVPSLIPPLSCLCGTAKQIARPFKVACPYCRSTFTVQPSAAGDSIGDQAVEK